MKLKNLSFKNTNTGWCIDNLSFCKLTLLVGASGVGKTQILRILMGLQNITMVGETIRCFYTGHVTFAARSSFQPLCVQI